MEPATITAMGFLIGFAIESMLALAAADAIARVQESAYNQKIAEEYGKAQTECDVQNLREAVQKAQTDSGHADYLDQHFGESQMRAKQARNALDAAKKSLNFAEQTALNIADKNTARTTFLYKSQGSPNVRGMKAGGGVTGNAGALGTKLGAAVAFAMLADSIAKDGKMILDILEFKREEAQRLINEEKSKYDGRGCLESLYRGGPTMQALSIDE